MLIIVSFILLLTVLMLIYCNTLFYTLSLLVISSILLLSLLSLNLIHGLTVLVVLVVYLGAMMVLIGYVCAVSPNLLIGSSVRGFMGLITFRVMYLLSLFLDSYIFSSDTSLYSSVSSFFFSSFGLVPLATVLLMLFLVLLIVTAQHTLPKGPFRSLS